MWCGLMLKHDLLPANIGILPCRRSPVTENVCANPGAASDFARCPRAPWPSGEETQRNNKTLIAASSQTIGNLKTKTKKGFLNLSKQACVSFCN